MDNKFIEKLQNELKQILKEKPKRYRHSLGVAHTSACLAMRYDVDMEMAYIAGLLHDSAKCLSDEELLKECKKYDIEVTEYEKQAPYLLHGKVGAYYLKMKFDIDNQEIASAIKYHTTGHANMTKLEMIVFIADYIEPFRDKAPDLDEQRRNAFKSLELAVCTISGNTLKYLNESNAKVDPGTLETFEYYKNLLD